VGDPHRSARASELLDLSQRLPPHARDRARAVAQLQAQVVAAVAPLAALDLAHQQHLVDLHTVDQLVQEHCLTVEAAADGTVVTGAYWVVRICARTRLPGNASQAATPGLHGRRGR
jgi:hypothetical protein